MATKRKASDDGDGARPFTGKKLKFSDEIAVVVGDEEKRYTVPRYILSESSSFFRTALSARWNKEEGMAVIKLPGQSAGVFETYLNYLYKGKIVLFDQEDDEVTIVDDVYAALLDLYLLTHYLQDLKACNTIADTWLDCDICEEHVPSSWTVTHAFTSLPSTNGLVRLCIAQTCVLKKGDAKRYVNAPYWPEDLNKELYLHCMRVKDAGQNLHDYLNETACQFHEHNDECPPCKQNVAKE